MESFRRVGYTPPSAANSGDHLGAELGLLSFLAGAFADAVQDGRADIAHRMQQEQHIFMQQHLLRWVTPCAIAVQRAGHAFYTEAANLLVALVADHWQQINASPSSAWDADIPLSAAVNHAPSLPTAPNLLDNEKTSLRDIAEFLITPSYAGIYLSRAAIGDLGRQQQLPRGFGERRLLLTNLLQAAAQYDQAVGVFQELSHVANSWCDNYAAVIALYPGLQPFVWPWQQRAAQTRELLVHMSRLIPQVDI
ncbi:MAG: molecular chaperone TorD family protein [Caldilineaceae bacterium]